MVMTFAISYVTPPSYAQIAGAGTQSIVNLPVPGTMITQTPEFTPPLIMGITVHPENPLQFDFIINNGDRELSGQKLKDEAKQLIKYFLASLTVPEEEMWVNLSPYEKDRIAPESFGQTEMGRDLLAQDYLLKQLTASMIYPEEELGQKFWDRVYDQAKDKYDVNEIPINTVTRVWIVPQEATIFEHRNSAFVVKSRLKVMLEEDYHALQAGSGNNKFGFNPSNVNEATADIARELLVPEIEKEVNEGKNFAKLRQIYNSMILATWYKINLEKGLLGQVYVDKNKIEGINVQDRNIKQKIYNQYIQALEKGVYSYIKEDYNPTTNESIPRKYFSGGFSVTEVELLPRNWTNFWKSPIGTIRDFVRSKTIKSDPLKSLWEVVRIAPIEVREFMIRMIKSAQTNNFEVNLKEAGIGIVPQWKELEAANEPKFIQTKAAASPVTAASPAVQQNIRPEVPGGIDFDPQLLDLQIKRDGRGIPLPLPMQNIDHININGFLPIIINVTPISNLPMYIGFADTEDDTTGSDDSLTFDFFDRKERFDPQDIDTISLLN